MNIIRYTPSINITIDNQLIKSINTIQEFYEYEDRIILKCAEDVPEFKRGLICDLDCEFELYDTNSCEKTGTRKESVKNLVLVYINKSSDMESATQFEYTFYK